MFVTAESASQSAVRPYILVGGGFAHLKRDTTFTVAGADVTGNLTQDQYGNIVLGSDLTGSTTKPMIEIGGGVVVPIAGRLLLDFRLRYDRLVHGGRGRQPWTGWRRSRRAVLKCLR